MYVVHAVWTRGQVALWAEDSTLPALPPRRRGRVPRRRPHPFAVDRGTLGTLVSAPVEADDGAPLALDLPSSGGPLASPELVRDEAPRVDAPVTAATWQVPALLLRPDRAHRLLGDCMDVGDADGAMAGASLRYLHQVAEFARDLVRRGRVLPAVHRHGSGARAVWWPVLTGADAVWVRALALAVPASFACVREDSTDPSPGAARHRVRVLAAALDALVDAAARAATADMTLDRRSGGSPAVRSWLGALCGRDGRVEADDASVVQLSRDLAEWQREAVGGPVRACFRVVEPEVAAEISGAVDVADGLGRPDPAHPSDPARRPRPAVGPDANWRIRFALQAADEPSLVVEAAAVWRSRDSLRALARHVDSPQETLLAELGRASRLYPDLEPALRTARPSELAVDAAGVHHFLRDVAPLLSGAGFGVLLPSWWNRPAARLGLKVTARTAAQPARVAGVAGRGLGDLAEFSYELALGDDTLAAEELAQLAELKMPLVRLRGQWVELDARRLATGLRLVGGGGRATVGEVLRLSTLASGESDELPVVAVRAEGWLGDLLSGQAEHRLAPVPLPSGFVGQLRPYQQRGLAWLDFLTRIGVGGVLADDMGLGKTVQLLALLAAELDVPHRAAPDGGAPDGGAPHDAAHPGRRTPTLLVCPMSLVGNWQREASRFTPHLRVHVHHGAERPRGARFAEAVSSADLVITTYALAARDAAALATVGWRRVVVDEAQAIKNAATRQASAIRSLPAAARIAVTGTPVENRLADLWSILEFANPGLLGSAAAFKTRYAEPIERRGDDEAAERLRMLTGPFVLRRLKTDRTIIQDLPDKIEMDVLCNLTGEQASLYQAVVADMLQRIETTAGMERRGLVLATMTKLKQVCNHPAHFLRDGSRLAGRSGKLLRLDEILGEVLAVGDKALLFTQYTEFGALLQGHLVGRFGREVLFLHGGLGKADRDRMIGRFQDGGSGSPALFVLSLKAGGTGLTLTAANHVVHVDRWWNPAVEDQATDRAFRIGQRRSVQVRRFVCAGTVEEKIAAMIAEKRGLAARIVGTGEQWLTELSTGRLRELFRLEAQAVVE